MKLKTRQEIAQEYGISRKTLYRKLVAVGIELDRGFNKCSGSGKDICGVRKAERFKNVKTYWFCKRKKLILLVLIFL